VRGNMKLYGMNLDDDNTIIPKDVQKKLNNIINQEKKDNSFSIDDAWEITKNACVKYIETSWINGLGIDKNELLEDIKEYSIFTILYSYTQDDLKFKNTMQNIKEYCETHKEGKDPDNEYKNFNRKLNSCINEIFNNMHIVTTDFYYCIESSLLPQNDNCREKYLIGMDFDIFYNIINNWKYCPYNRENLFGMEFKELYKFYENLEYIINITDNCVEQAMRAFIVERLFNISFINELSVCIDNKINDNDIFDELYSMGITKVKGINPDKNSYLNKYSSTMISKAYLVIILKELVSIPMVFSRNKYLKLIIEQNKIVNECVLNEMLVYLNYLIMLLSKVYFDALNILLKKTNIALDIKERIKEECVNYIERNIKKFDYKSLMIHDVYKFKYDGVKALEVNLTQIIYNYTYHNITLDNNQNIFEVIKDLEKERVGYYLSSRYNHQYYFLNFPFNSIYSTYEFNKKLDKKYSIYRSNKKNEK